MGSSSPNFGMKIPKIFELPPPRVTIIEKTISRSFPLTEGPDSWLRRSHLQGDRGPQVSVTLVASHAGYSARGHTFTLGMRVFDVQAGWRWEVDTHHIYGVYGRKPQQSMKVYYILGGWTGPHVMNMRKSTWDHFPK